MVAVVAVLGLVLLLLTVGYFGQRSARKHYVSILEREERLRGLLLIQSRLPPQFEAPPRTALVGGKVALTANHFHNFVCALQNLLGGRLTPDESLVDRARREAVLRIKEKARAEGATMIMNVKFDAVQISRYRLGGFRVVEAFVYGTALIPNG